VSIKKLDKAPYINNEYKYEAYFACTDGFQGYFDNIVNRKGLIDTSDLSILNNGISKYDTIVSFKLPIQQGSNDISIFSRNYEVRTGDSIGKRTTFLIIDKTNFIAIILSNGAVPYSEIVISSARSVDDKDYILSGKIRKHNVFKEGFCRVDINDTER
jgi:hypothetical protein